MKRIGIIAALLLGTATAGAGQAPPQAMYKDLIRPNGYPRSEAIHQADLDACYQQTGQSRYEPDGPAFKKCMLSRGYRFMWQRGFGGGSGGTVAQSHWRIHVDGGRGIPCMTLQAHVADLLENSGGADPELIRELRTRCLPQDHNPADYDPRNPFYVAPNN